MPIEKYGILVLNFMRILFNQDKGKKTNLLLFSNFIVRFCKLPIIIFNLPAVLFEGQSSDLIFII
jgi:hypothetical protein